MVLGFNYLRSTFVYLLGLLDLCHQNAFYLKLDLEFYHGVIVIGSCQSNVSGCHVCPTLQDMPARQYCQSLRRLMLLLACARVSCFYSTVLITCRCLILTCCTGRIKGRDCVCRWHRLTACIMNTCIY